MKYLVKRNLLLFFRDKAAVFFSLLSCFIIIGLYLLFLGDVMSSGFGDLEGIRYLIDSWIMAGVIAVAPITTTLGAMENIVQDKKLKIYKDFYSSPVTRSELSGGYVVSSIVISLIMTLVTLILAEIYIKVNGGEILNLDSLVRVLGIVVLNCVSSTFAVNFFVSFVNSPSAFSAASTIVGTLIGFLTGIYIPIGHVPEFVQMIIKIFPPSHAAVLLRSVMMEQAEKIAFANAPQSIIESFRLEMGASFEIGGNIISWQGSAIYLLAMGIVFFALSVWRESKKVK